MVGRVKPQSSEPPVSKMRIGTSGWTYDGWRGPFYPPDISKREWLAFYGGSFSTTEINGSFYRTPSLEAVTAWRDQTPDDFLFAWKASKFITHWKRLTEKCENRIALMETRLRVLRAKAGPVLFQLPARFTREPRAARGIHSHAAEPLRICVRISSPELVRRRDLRSAARERHFALSLARRLLDLVSSHRASGNKRAA